MRHRIPAELVSLTTSWLLTRLTQEEFPSSGLAASASRLYCSSQWQPPQRRQLPAVRSHINPQGEIRAKWLLLRGDGFDSHGRVTAARLPPTSLSQPQTPSCLPHLIRFWNHRTGSRFRGLPARPPNTCQSFIPMTPQDGYKYCYLLLIRWCYSKGEACLFQGK